MEEARMKTGRAIAAALVLVIALVLTTAQAATINITADITTSQTWTANNEYILTQPIYVTSGATLTIEPGTVVRGEPAAGAGTNDPGTLIITRGSKLQALGTARRPVVFTDLNDDNVGDNYGSGAYGDRLDRSVVGQWGGVVLLGYGYVANNTAAGVSTTREVQIEGLTATGGLGLYGNCAAFLAGPYGRNCDDGDSGTLRYVRVSYGGFNLSANNEINGITLGGVGRETDLGYFEVYQTKDDAIELFGGAANFKYAVLANHGDDGIDYDEGWRGKAQFVFQMMNVPGTEVTDKGGEWDGGNNPDGSLPKAIPTLCNLTFVGQGADKTTYTNHDRNTATHLRDNAGTRVYNSAFLDFGGAPACIEGGNGIAGSATAAGSSGERAITPYVVDGVYYLDPPSAFELEFQDNVYWKFGSDTLLGNALPTVGSCSITTATPCTQNTECPAGETCVNGPARWGCDAAKKHYDNGLFTNAALRNTKLGALDPLPIRALTRLGSGNPSTQDAIDVIDPLPAVGGPLETTVQPCPTAGGFLEAAPFKGAFAPNQANWAEGWTLVSRLGYFGPKPQVTISADIATSQTWTSDKEYVLTQPIYVTSGATLTINPGTVVRGEPAAGAGTNDPGTLIVTRGSKLQANGNPDQVIVFTDLDDDNVGNNYGDGLGNYADRTVTRSVVGNWGGVVLLGYGYVANNTAAGVNTAREVQIEGLTATGGLGLYGNCAAFLAGPYGRNCDDGDSGTLRYVRVSYGGFNLSANNEINGITLGGVGRGTTLERFEVYQTKDDAIELFGGAANFKYAALENHGDDGVDYDEGWRGKAQFVFQMMNVPGTEVTDKGGEWDGGNNPDGSLPKAIPTLMNLTFVGQGADKTTYATHDRNTATHLRDNAGTRVYNSAFLDFGGAPACIEGGNGIAGSATAAASSGERAITPYVVDGVYYLDPPSAFELEFQDNVYWKFGSDTLLGNALPTVGNCSITTATACTQNTECPAGETCVNGPARWGCDAAKKHYDNGLFTNAALRNTRLAGSDPLPITTLTRVASGNPATQDAIDIVDPRPASGSPLATTARTAVPAGGFFEYAPYKGAFAPGRNWAAGWTLASRLGYTGTCDPAAGVTQRPDEVGGVSFPSKTRMEWSNLPPLFGYVFDVLRSTTASDFSTATCLLTNDANASVVDATLPASGQVFYYLVRAENSCGAGSLGNRSSGVERTGSNCP
jgi:hypothetical protein